MRSVILPGPPQKLNARHDSNNSIGSWKKSECPLKSVMFDCIIKYYIIKYQRDTQLHKQLHTHIRSCHEYFSNSISFRMCCFFFFFLESFFLSIHLLFVLSVSFHLSTPLGNMINIYKFIDAFPNEFAKAKREIIYALNADYTHKRQYGTIQLTAK